MGEENVGRCDKHGLVNEECARCGNPQMVRSHPHDMPRTAYARYDCPKCHYSYLSRKVEKPEPCPECGGEMFLRVKSTGAFPGATKLVSECKKCGYETFPPSNPFSY